MARTSGCLILLLAAGAAILTQQITVEATRANAAMRLNARLYIITVQDLDLPADYVHCMAQRFASYKRFGAYTLGVEMSMALKLPTHESFTRVWRPEEANLFFVEYDPSVDLGCSHCTVGFDTLAHRLTRFHGGDASWRNQPHFLASSRPSDWIPRQLLRKYGQRKVSERGSPCFMDHDARIIKFVEEKWGRRNTRRWNSTIMDKIVGVPKTTDFADDLGHRKSIAALFEASASPRPHLVSFVGKPKTPSRKRFVKACEALPDEQCKVVDLAKKGHPTGTRIVEVVKRIYSQSTFCFQHSGDDLTRSGVWDAMFSGCIPIIISPHILDTQYSLHVPHPERVSVLFGKPRDSGDVRTAIAELAHMKRARIRGMQQAIADLLPTISWTNGAFVGRAVDYLMQGPGVAADFDEGTRERRQEGPPVRTVTVSGTA